MHACPSHINSFLYLLYFNLCLSHLFPSHRHACAPPSSSSLFKMVSSSAFFDPVSGASIEANNEAVGMLTGIPKVEGWGGGY